MGYRKRVLNPQVRSIVWVMIAVIVFAASFFIGNVMRSKRSSDAATVPDDTRVEERSELSYYLKVKYDGVDRNGVTSSNSVTSEVRSNTIIVKDKVPDGLIFQGFVTTNSGTIGAVKRSDGSTACPGSVIDDSGNTTGWINNDSEYVWHGLHYIASTRTVSFRVKDLLAGCQLQVGIKTKTPLLEIGQDRMDFYNTAGYLEGDLSGKSNTTHHFIGKDNVTRYQVRYQYAGTVPSGAPSAPSTAEYAPGQLVGVEAEPSVEGYAFSGWTTSNATISNGSFEMPANIVNLSGSFTEKQKYSVTYSVTGAPSSYHVPDTKQYGGGDYVELDDLAANTVIDGYRFNGWTVSGATVSDGGFYMPSGNVTISGSFTRISYSVSYRFIGSVTPSNASSLLPATSNYYPGDSVTIANEPTASRYRFLGWNRQNFTMPEENVIIDGEWAAVTGVFRPNIAQRITNLKDKYYKGDKVNFEITITNPDSFAISDVSVGLDLDGAKFVPGTGYSIRSDRLAKITSISPNGSVKLYAEFDVTDNITKTWNNIATLLSAVAANGYSMDVSDEALASYRKTVVFNTESWNDVPVFTGIDLNRNGSFVILTALGAIGGVFVVLRNRRSIK